MVFAEPPSPVRWPRASGWARRMFPQGRGEGRVVWRGRGKWRVSLGASCRADVTPPCLTASRSPRAAYGPVCRVPASPSESRRVGEVHFEAAQISPFARWLILASISGRRLQRLVPRCFCTDRCEVSCQEGSPLFPTYVPVKVFM